MNGGRPNGPIETKVIAGSAGAGAGAIIAGGILWALDTWAFHGPVPEALSQLVSLLVTVALAAGAGWLAPHTLRRDPAALAATRKPPEP